MTWGSALRTAVGWVLGPALLLLSGSAAGDTLALESRSMSLDRGGTRSMLGSVKRWGCQFQKVHLAEIEASDLDMIVLDITLDGTPGRSAAPSELAQLKRKPDGGRRIVLAYLSVGEAADYRSYWQPDWSERPPGWLGRENPNWPRAYPVRFWAPEWQAILFGKSSSMLDEILAAGFDGVFLDRIDVYGEWLKERFTAPQDMVALVSAIARYARSSNQDFVVIGQNSEALLTDESYRTALDAVSKESLLFGLGGEGLENTPEQIAWSERLLREGSAAGLHVFAIEYLSDPERIEEARRRLLQLGFTPFFGHRLLDRLPE